MNGASSKLGDEADRLEQILKTSGLTPEKQAELLQALNRNNSSVNLVLGGSNITFANIVLQIQTMEKPELATVLAAIAERLSQQP